MKTVKFKEWECELTFLKYGNGRHAITLDEVGTGEPIAVASVNLPDATIEDDEVIIKNWSENEGVLELLVEAGIVTPLRKLFTGFVQADVCRLNVE